MKYDTINKRLLNWPEFPLLRVLIYFVLGIFLSSTSYLPMSILFLVFFSLVLTSYYFQKIRIDSHLIIHSTSSILFVLFILLGVIRGSIQSINLDKHHYGRNVIDNHLFVGKVSDDIIQKKSLSTRLSLISIDGKNVRGDIMVYFKDSILSYAYGDIIQLNGRASLISNNKNPYGFDYKQFMLYKGISHQLFVGLGQHSLVHKKNDLDPMTLAFQMKSYAHSIFEKRLTNKENLATASAMVLGKRDQINPELKSAFSDTGAIHVLAVSGLHVGIILLLFRLIFNRIRSESNVLKAFKFISLSLIVICYAMVTGCAPAVMRASVMFISLEFGRLWFTNTNVYNILSLSAIGLLIYNPFYLFQLGFLFSYLALISIIFFQPMLMKVVHRYVFYDKWIVEKFWQLVTVSIAAQVLVFPMSIYFFHKFPLAFILSGVLAVSLAPFILSLGLLLIVSDTIPYISDIIAFFLENLLHLFIEIIYFINEFSFLSIRNIFISELSMFYLYMAILAFMFILAYREKAIQAFHKPNYKSRKIAGLIIYASIVGLIANSIYFTFKNKSRQKFILYNFSKHSMFDVFIGSEVFSIQSTDIDTSKFNYINQEVRIRYGNPEEIKLKSTDSIIEPRLVLNSEGIFFSNNHLISVNSVFDGNRYLCYSDVLLIDEKTTIHPFDVMMFHITKQVVIDASITYKIRKAWTLYCEDNHIPYHDVKKKGAYILE